MGFLKVKYETLSYLERKQIYDEITQRRRIFTCDGTIGSSGKGDHNNCYSPPPASFVTVLTRN